MGYLPMDRMVQARVTEDLVEAMKRLRRRTGMSESDIIRQGITLLDRIYRTPRRRIAKLGAFASDVADLGSNKAHLKGFGKAGTKDNG